MAYQYRANQTASITMARLQSESVESGTDTFGGINPTVSADTLVAGMEQLLTISGQNGDGVYYDYTNDKTFRTVKQNIEETA